MNELVGLVAGSGFASGLNLYATALLLGLYGRFLDTGAVPGELTATPVLVVAGVLTAVEFVADKVPWFDSVWDTVHTFVRPAGAGLIAAVLLDGGSPFAQVVGSGVDPAAATGGLGSAAGVGLAVVLALVSHGAKASTRVAINTSPEPFSNSIVSVIEDGVVAGVVWLAVEHPAVAAVVVAVLVLAAIGIIALLWRTVRAVRARMRDRPLRQRITSSRRRAPPVE